MTKLLINVLLALVILIVLPIAGLATYLTIQIVKDIHKHHDTKDIV